VAAAPRLTCTAFTVLRTSSSLNSWKICTAALLFTFLKVSTPASEQQQRPLAGTVTEPGPLASQRTFTGHLGPKELSVQRVAGQGRECTGQVSLRHYTGTLSEAGPSQVPQ
jgi:hypothetical protein